MAKDLGRGPQPDGLFTTKLDSLEEYVEKKLGGFPPNSGPVKYILLEYVTRIRSLLTDLQKMYVSEYTLETVQHDVRKNATDAKKLCDELWNEIRAACDSYERFEQLAVALYGFADTLEHAAKTDINSLKEKVDICKQELYYNGLYAPDSKIQQALWDSQLIFNQSIKTKL